MIMIGLIDNVWLQDAASRWVPMFLDAAAKGFIVLAAIGLITVLMRRTSAARRHTVWVLGMAVLLLLPLLSALLPGWAVMPQWFDVDAEQQEVRTEEAVLSPPVALIDQEYEPAGEFTREQGPWRHDGPPQRTSTDLVERVEDQFDVGHAEASSIASTSHQTPAPTQTLAEEAQPESAFVLAARWGVLIWAAGAVLCLAPLVLGRFSLWRLQRGARPITGGTWMLLYRRTSVKLGLRREVVLLQSDRRTMPMVWGIFRPKLLIPDVASEWSDERRQVVLLHELAHAARWDCLAKFLAHLACALYWFNPLVWIAFRRSQMEAEAACDDMVLVSGSKASDYAGHLLEIASGLRSGMLAVHSSIAIARKSRIEARLLAILDSKRNRRRMTLLGVILAAVLIAGLAIPTAMLQAKGLRNPVQLDENGKPIITHVLYMRGEPEKLMYRLEEKTYYNIDSLVAHISELMKGEPFPMIRVRTTLRYQKDQTPIDRLSKRCREIGFINMEFKYDLTVPPQPATRPTSKPAEGKLELRIRPLHKISEEDLVRYRKILKNDGAAGLLQRDEKYIWLPVRDGLPSGGPSTSAQKDGVRYALVANQEDKIILPGQGGSKYRAYTAKDDVGRPAIEVRFNRDGTRLVNALTGRVSGCTLAVVIDGTIYSWLRIRSPIRTLLIQSLDDKRKVSELVERLNVGLKPRRLDRRYSVGGRAQMTYIVQDGDDLRRIAEKVYGDTKYWSVIQAANPVRNWDHLEAGQYLTIPRLPPGSATQPARK